MPRKLRIQYPGAIYHVMNRGVPREDVFRNQTDREQFLGTLGEACGKTQWQVHAYCLMRNHFHLVVETPEPNLVDGMKWLLGTYTKRFNIRHKLCGHLFAGRYKALLVEGSGDGYLRTVCDYVHLNPVRAHLVPAQAPLQAYGCTSNGQLDLCVKPAGRAGQNANLMPKQLAPVSIVRTDTCPSPSSRGNPGYINDNDTDRNQLLANLALPETRNFSFHGHGSCETIGNGTDDQHPGTVQIDTALMHTYLENDFFSHGKIINHAYRFVLLDSCNAADALDWAHAFGIPARITAAELAEAPTKVQAFVGWLGKPEAPENDPEWREYTDTLAVFFGAWMTGLTLDECIDKASKNVPGEPFPWKILNFPLGHKHWKLFRGNAREFRIRVYGYAGITRSGYQEGHDNSKRYE